MKSRKILSLFLSMLMLISIIPLGTVISAAETSGDFKYAVLSEEEKTCKIKIYIGSASELTIPSQIDGYTVTDIGYLAFSHCTSLKSITIPESVTWISTAFYGCSSLENIYVSTSNKKYCAIDGVLFNKDATELICFPGGKSGDYIIPNGVTSIYDAFGKCPQLTSVTIPDSAIYYIAWDAFDGCTSIQNIYVSSGNENYCDIDGVLFNKDATKLIYFPKGRSGDYTIPDSVTSIGDYIFRDCTLMKNIYVSSDNENYCAIDGVLFNKDATELICFPKGRSGDYTIPNSMTSIDDGAFQSCNSLTSITIPDSVTSIGFRTFNDCPSMQNIYVSSGNENYSDIDGVLFNKDATELICCPSGKSGDYTISNSVTSIGNFAFEDCTLIENIYVSSGNENYSDIDGVLFNKDATELIYFPKGRSGDYTIPNSVTDIRYGVFSNCTLTSLTISNRASGFEFCTSIKSLRILDGVTSIEWRAFRGCTSLTNIEIPDSVTSIDDGAFQGCNSLTSITIPNTVTNIGYAAFGYDNGYWIENEEFLKKIDGFTIYGEKGSAAESYAVRNGFAFVALDAEPSIVQFGKSQIRFHGVGADKDFSKYQGKFDVRTVANISQEDFINTFGSEENALENITDIGFIYAAEKNVQTFDIETAKGVAESTVTDENYVKKSVNYIQHAGDGADYIFTCIITDVPDADKDRIGYCYAYVCCNGTYYYFDDVAVMDFNSLYVAHMSA